LVINDILSALSQAASEFPPFLPPLTSAAISLDTGITLEFSRQIREEKQEGFHSGLQASRTDPKPSLSAK
jgi:hypothetical protein